MTPEDALELPVIPELEDDYELIRELGRGGTAVVYLARERELGRYVAIKLMHPAYVQDEEAMARMVREAKTISRLQHPNIVMLYGARRLGERGYALVLQFVPGTTVKERLRRDGPLPLPLVERVLTDLCTALQYAHRHRIVHRDIKPENVFLDEDTGAARLADFGIARFWDSDSGLTLPGTALGTPNYMSPEQVDGRVLDGRSDLYSVGLVAWEMLTGRQPWGGETIYKVVYKQKNEELPPLAELRPDVPHYFRVAIEGTLKKDPAQRWRDAGEFLAALQNPYAHLARPRKPGLKGAREVSGAPDLPRPDAGLEDAETILLTRDDVERSWARAPLREAPPRPAVQTPASGEPARGSTRPAASVEGPSRPAVAPSPTPPAPETAAAPDAALATPASAGAPTGPAPRWLVALEEGQVQWGMEPWWEVEARRRRNRLRVAAVLGVLALLVAVLLVLAYWLP